MITNDVLSSVLRLLRFNASVFFHSSYCGSWTIDTSGSGRSTFHLIASGNCYLHLPDEAEAIPLSKGDLIVFPLDSKHSITDSADPNAKDVNSIPSEGDSCDVKESTALICGYFDFDEPKRNPVINALPNTVIVKGHGNKVEPRLQTLIDLMKSETEKSITGSDVVIDKLSEILFIYALRSYINAQSPKSGILAALSDVQISRALDAIHDKPENAWTVEKLAAVAGLSRAPFSKHFSELLGQPPMTYVGEWRMQLANVALKEGRNSMAEIAESVGYHSEVAFRKAFKQITGITPGTARKAV
jgi:AraC-like DNA-binding protein